VVAVAVFVKKVGKQLLMSSYCSQRTRGLCRL